MDPKNHIEPLPASTRSKIRSTQILTSLPQIVSELMQNSLDAGARHVDVGVDCDGWTCWVRDDGTGMSKDALTAIEERYATSKAYDPDSLNVLSTFGFRGEALASAADLCCLEISSRTAVSRETWSVILKGGQTLYSGAAVRWRRETPGTVVCVRDALYNLPVRRRSHPSPARTLELIKQEIETYALVFPSVAFSLENTNAVRNSGPVVKVPKTPSSLCTFRHLFGKALVQHVEEINTSENGLTLEGFISLDGAPSKAYQYIYVNKHPIDVGDLHRLIDAKFAASTFAKHAYDETGETSLRPTSRRSPRKSEKKPVYVLNLAVPPSEVDNCLEPAKGDLHFRVISISRFHHTILLPLDSFQNKGTVITLLSNAVQSFLSRNGFSSNMREGSLRNDASPPPLKRRKTNIDDSGYVSDEDMDGGGLELQHTATPLFIRREERDKVPGEFVWTDPTTGQGFIVNSRTGDSRACENPILGGDEVRDVTLRTLNSRITFPRSKQTSGADKSVMPEWIQEALEANNAYTQTERKIPSISISDSTLWLNTADAPGRKNPSHGCQSSRYFPSGQHNPMTYAMTIGGSSSHRYRKEDLRNAHVINQVDRKFIACLINDTGQIEGGGQHGRALVLIDQHAADERIRVERFLKILCSGFLYSQTGGQDKTRMVETRLLSPNIPILLTRHEAIQLACRPQVRSILRHWGFGFCGLDTVGSESEPDSDESGYTQIMVDTIPELVGNKLLVGDELRDLVKGSLSNPDLSGDPAVEDSTPESDENSFVWLKALRWCPRELMDLVNSKACRGAIMFNDALSMAQCERLVLQLANTAFPFQCAHGRSVGLFSHAVSLLGNKTVYYRPSLVPLTDISRDATGSKGGPIFWSQLEHTESNLH
ncbi:uncharacterized protein EV420DRAFT_1305145 [Desarmillaria tabescens]|uniref:MutL C-terminal dimerisation domain-containing protein n=1 Tax=Armillaria tabescens TaxID=1929756 RepID=A0AA39NA40_ARMTA|nr:uncharacterized protein EV420DRAFT_1305145 [Desarmillaria tabescens]KAK0461814.1 hypothetical protein EV420DRAFT_1305145 [Desarmillaria tabescens]